MVNHVEAFRQVKQAEESDVLAVGGGKDMIGYCKKRGKRIVRRKSRETGSRVKAQAPTLGRRQGS